jgi:hypothetical protein
MVCITEQHYHYRFGRFQLVGKMLYRLDSRYDMELRISPFREKWDATQNPQLDDIASRPSRPIPPPGFEADPSGTSHESSKCNAKRRLSIGVALILFSVFPASFSSPLLTGPISWRASVRNTCVSDADVVTNIGLGVNGDDTDPWASWGPDMGLRTRYIHRAGALATHAWTSVTDNFQDPPTFKRVIPSLLNLPVASSLKNATLPWFNIESFGWVTNGAIIRAEQLTLLTLNSNPGVLSSTDDYVITNSAPLPSCQTSLTRPSH